MLVEKDNDKNTVVALREIGEFKTYPLMNSKRMQF